MTAIINAKLFYYQLPFYKAINFNSHRLKDRQGLVLQLQHAQGDFSYGEIAPLPGFSCETLIQSKEQIISYLDSGLSPLSPQADFYPSVNFGLDCALQGLPITAEALNIDPVPLLQGDNIASIAQYKKLNKPALVKLKVARQNIDTDIRLFNQLVSLNPSIMIRCDANQQWLESQAGRFFKNINRQHLDYIEEPTPLHAINLELGKHYQIGLGLDETLQDTAFNFQAHSSIKALVLKPTLIGSITRLEKFIEIAAQQNIQVHISSSFESIIGLKQLTALANIYQKRCSLTLGIDTLKYFQQGPLTKSQWVSTDLEQLECIWKSH
jgi:O-succinylbenzoate synthase